MHGLDLFVRRANHLVVGQRGTALVLIKVSDGGVKRQVALQEQAVCLALLGNQSKAVLHGVTRRGKVHQAITEVHRACRTGTNTKDRLEQLGTSGADQTIQTKDLALAHVEGDVHQVRIEFRGQVLHRKNVVAGNVIHGRETVVQRTADHGAYELVHVGVTRALGHNQITVTQNRHVVADLEDLVHLVRDVDQSDALLLELTHHLEQLIDLLRHQRTGRLVQNDNFGVIGHSLGDLDHLALRDTHVFHGLGQVDGHTQTTEQVRSLFAHARLVDHTALNRITAQEQVIDHVTLEALVELLVDHGDAVFESILRTGEAHLLAIEENGTLVLLISAEQAFHHRGLACAVLTHQAHDGAAADVEVDVIEYAVAPERLAHPSDRQDDVVLLV